MEKRANATAGETRFFHLPSLKLTVTDISRMTLLRAGIYLALSNEGYAKSESQVANEKRMDVINVAIAILNALIILSFPYS